MPIVSASPTVTGRGGRSGPELSTSVSAASLCILTFPDILRRAKRTAGLTLSLFAVPLKGQLKMHIKTLTVTTVSLLFTAALASAQTSTTCGQTIGQDLKAINADLSAIASQAKAQGFGTAAEQFAADLETILPTLSRPSQAAVEKFASDLVAATSASSPGGTEITASERLKLTNDWTIVVTSTGITSDQIATISNDLVNALSALRGISTEQLRSDVNTLVADVSSCRARE